MVPCASSLPRWWDIDEFWSINWVPTTVCEELCGLQRCLIYLFPLQPSRKTNTKASVTLKMLPSGHSQGWGTPGRRNRPPAPFFTELRPRSTPAPSPHYPERERRPQSTMVFLGSLFLFERVSRHNSNEWRSGYEGACFWGLMRIWTGIGSTRCYPEYTVNDLHCWPLWPE